VSTGVPAGAESSAEDTGPQCYQGHRSAAGSRFCETCGALLDAEPEAAAELPAELATEYTSGSFSDFFREDTGEDAGAAPIQRAAASGAFAGAAVANESGATGSAAAGSTATESAAAGSGTASSAAVTRSGALAGSAVAIAGRFRRRGTLAVGLAIAAAAAAAITGELTLNHGAKPQAQAPARPLGAVPSASVSAAPTAVPSASASVAPTPSPTPPPAVVPAQPIPATAGHQPTVPNGHHGFFPGRRPVHFVLPGPPFVPRELAAQERQIVLRIVASLPVFGHGGLPQPGGFHRP
jgi:hypothetical protein